MEDLAGEKEMSEQLKFENFLPETPEIVPALPGEFQPRKVEEVIPDKNIPEDTYLIYPTGGHHLFYEVPNALPRYQLPIWPYVKRIKFNKEKMDLYTGAAGVSIYHRLIAIIEMVILEYLLASANPRKIGGLGLLRCID